MYRLEARKRAYAAGSAPLALTGAERPVLTKRVVDKTVVSNVIRHVDLHNKALEDAEMWKSRQLELQLSRQAADRKEEPSAHRRVESGYSSFELERRRNAELKLLAKRADGSISGHVDTSSPSDTQRCGNRSTCMITSFSLPSCS